MHDLPVLRGIHKGYSGVDRVQNARTSERDNVVAYLKTCNFMKGPLLSVKEFWGKINEIAGEILTYLRKNPFLLF